MSLLETVTARFRERFGQEPAHVVRAPGRVNLLGEHVDYNDGFVLPIAIDRAAWLAFSPGDSDRTTLSALDLSEEVLFTPESISGRTDAAGKPLPAWALYPAGVMWALREAGLGTPPLNGVYASNVPQGSGLSSSASVEMAFVLAEPGAAGAAEVHGVVRLIADPDHTRAEFAIVVERKLTGLGLGAFLMRHLIDYARSRGIGELYGDVLEDNAVMRNLCRALGFVERTADDHVVRVTLPLGSRPS